MKIGQIRVKRKDMVQEESNRFLSIRSSLRIDKLQLALDTSREALQMGKF